MTDGPPPLDRRRALIEALAWQVELGADAAIAAAPVDRTRPATPAPPEAGPRQRPARAIADLPTSGLVAEALSPERRPAPATPPAAPQADAASARAIAAAAADIPALKAALEGFDGSPLKAGARATVFADGAPGAELMVVGEAPGREEDAQGLPFVGRSGQLLDRMLAAIGRARRDNAPEKGAYISNVIPYRPLENRTPNDQEVQLLLPFILRHIALARPKIVLCAGNVPAKHLMGADRGITRFRGEWRDIEIEGRAVPMLASFHPAYLLRSPEQKRLAWTDLLTLEGRLRG